ncbi:MAG: hypothetical protein CMK64_04950 [Pseudoalteromonas sp.]|nr:hypothetical protein [Pseudoalteromonas sp.]|tara:strand:- start:3483 stop:3950 length:468 start_codon:yes stop_codon:yes gene_type:complete
MSDLKNKLLKLGAESSTLDSIVDDAALRLASRVNNEGMKEQLRFLQDQVGMSENEILELVEGQENTMKNVSIVDYVNTINNRIKPFNIEITETEVVVSNNQQVLKKFDLELYNTKQLLVCYLAKDLGFTPDDLLYSSDELSDICYEALHPCGAMV